MARELDNSGEILCVDSGRVATIEHVSDGFIVHVSARVGTLKVDGGVGAGKRRALAERFAKAWELGAVGQVFEMSPKWKLLTGRTHYIRIKQRKAKDLAAIGF